MDEESTTKTRCTKCQEPREPEEYSFRVKKKGIRQVICKVCMRLYRRNKNPVSRRKVVVTDDSATTMDVRQENGHYSVLLEPLRSAWV